MGDIAPGGNAMSLDALFDFFDMGGHGVYVWGAYALALGLVLVEIVLLILRRRTIFGYLGWRAKQLHAQHRRHPRIASPTPPTAPKPDSVE
jgi:heme exporter protein D